MWFRIKTKLRPGHMHRAILSVWTIAYWQTETNRMRTVEEKDCQSNEKFRKRTRRIPIHLFEFHWASVCVCVCRDVLEHESIYAVEPTNLAIVCEYIESADFFILCVAWAFLFLASHSFTLSLYLFFSLICCGKTEWPKYSRTLLISL